MARRLYEVFPSPGGASFANRSTETRILSAGTVREHDLDKHRQQTRRCHSPRPDSFTAHLSGP